MSGPDFPSEQCCVQPEIAAAVSGLSDELQARFAVYVREEQAIEHELPAGWRALDRVLGDARERGERRRAEQDRASENARREV